MEYELIRSNRKTLALQVTNELRVLVRAPFRLCKRDIDRFVSEHETWIHAQIKKQRQRAETRGTLTQEDVQALTEQAHTIIPPLVRHYAAQMGLTPAAVKITLAKTRFGSCSAKNSLCFSAYLMRYPVDAIEYVVVHELAHIRHKNHAAEFYALVGSVLPDYAARRKLLRI